MTSGTTPSILSWTFLIHTSIFAILLKQELMQNSAESKRASKHEISFFNLKTSSFCLSC